MREHLKRVLEIARPYRTRLILGLLCGFLSGALAPTLGVSLKLAVDAVFPTDLGAASGGPSAAGAGSASAGNQASQQVAATTQSPSKSAGKGLLSMMPSSFQRYLDRVNAWVRPSGPPSRTRLMLVIGFIPAAMFLRSLLAYLNTYLLSWVAIRAANDLRVRLFRHLVHLPLRFFNKSSTGDLMTRIDGAMAVHRDRKS